MLKEIVSASLVAKSGTTSNVKFWEAKGGLANGTEQDNMMKYLNSQGFSGNPKDALRAWAQSKSTLGFKGNFKDNMRNYFNNTANP